MSVFRFRLTRRGVYQIAGRNASRTKSGTKSTLLRRFVRSPGRSPVLVGCADPWDVLYVNYRIFRKSVRFAPTILRFDIYYQIFRNSKEKPLPVSQEGFQVEELDLHLECFRHRFDLCLKFFISLHQLAKFLAQVFDSLNSLRFEFRAERIEKRGIRIFRNGIRGEF